MTRDLPKIVVILGPTSSGKSDLACELSKHFNFEIINADSLQIYKYLDIGTAKPDLKILDSVPHHLISIIKPDEQFNAGIYREKANEVIDILHNRNKKILIVGGTYLYVRVLIEGLIEGVEPDTSFRDELKALRAAYGTEHIYNNLKDIDPESALSINENDYVRMERALEVYHLTGQKMSDMQKEHGFSKKKYNVFKIGIDIERELLKKIIERRLDNMMDRGFTSEVKSLRERGYDKSLKPMQSIGYKEINDYLDGVMSLEDAREKIIINTRRLAKRQMTWLRRDKEINWYKIPQDFKHILEDLNTFYEN